ncbi:CxxH/CxxC protein [Desmospora profundinema]|uniref:CxxH/CxxC protein (TIGR04129 family) n=1 Tax=Desmospora profundinema TaxID=1571184 RepID=A0ABU1IKX9_9BACL|nr:CxxH/CxxC protein [Desmospora profundinema]MDR6225398.1 CxxH/CxxC protein (TIGR04129 family) [Desmospora profundinema]
MTNVVSWYACEEHVELVIDDFVDRYQLAPEIEPSTNVDQTKTPERIRCRQCGGTPVYHLTAASA